MKKKFWEFKNLIADESADLYIYHEIASWDDEYVTSANSFKEDLESLGVIKNLNLYINSPGGSVSDGLAIASMIKRHPAFVTAYIDSMACSIASVIACACDKVVMPRNTMLMIHNALVGGFFYGNSKDFRKQADDLDKITASLRQTYLEKAGDKLTEEQLIELMDAESWLTAKESFDLGLCDEIIESNKMVACVKSKVYSNFVNIPDNIKVLINQEEGSMEDDTVTPIQDASIAENNEDLHVVIENLKNEKIELEQKLNAANEKVIELNEQLTELTPIIDKYNAELAAKKAEDDAKFVNEKREYYKNKFDKIGAKAHFESEEVQALITNCVNDESAISKLNLMLVDMIQVSTGESKVIDRVELGTTIDNLMPQIETVQDKYGFR